MFPKGIIIGNFVSILNTVDTPNAMMWFYCSVTMLKRVGENNLTTEELKKKFFFTCTVMVRTGANMKPQLTIELPT